MKHAFETLKQRLDFMMNENIATKDRHWGFRIVVITLLITAICFVLSGILLKGW